MTIIEFEERTKYQNGYDREFDDWKIIDVHQIPSEFNIKCEIDFYCSDGYNIYILRLRNRKNEDLSEKLINTSNVCSLGQITDALFKVDGQYHRNM